ncbi:Zinc finger RNA-binding protein 2 [Microtus ochrogaster]|uniref:Zinc finger RNA-binding protein 2 n=1 Tax=Microtus ochrogaster TaxID=79684 RepID=A0A8J6GCA6_MICOH|nr:Zinc finger RNA-binding protein 2 [Microtus ochrogaster]
MRIHSSSQLQSLCWPGPSSHCSDHPPEFQQVLQKQQASQMALVGTDAWGVPGLKPWDPNFISDTLLFLNRLPKPTAGPRPPFMHYQEACRVSCAGPQTYQDHLEEKKLWKKLMAQMTGTQPSGGLRGSQSLHCSLSAVSCTRVADAYAAQTREPGPRRSPCCTKGHTPQAWSVPASGPSSPMLLSSSLLPAEVNVTTSPC